MCALDRRADVCLLSLFRSGEHVFALLERQAEEIIEDGAMDLVGAAVATRNDHAIEVAGVRLFAFARTSALHGRLQIAVAPALPTRQSMFP